MRPDPAPPNATERKVIQRTRDALVEIVQRMASKLAVLRNDRQAALGMVRNALLGAMLDAIATEEHMLLGETNPERLNALRNDICDVLDKHFVALHCQHTGIDQ